METDSYYSGCKREAYVFAFSWHPKTQARTGGKGQRLRFHRLRRPHSPSSYRTLAGPMGLGGLPPPRDRRRPLCLPVGLRGRAPGSLLREGRAQGGGFPCPPQRPWPGRTLGFHSSSQAMPRPVARLAVPPNLQPGPRARQGSPQLCFLLSPCPARPTSCLFYFLGLRRVPRARNSCGLPRRLFWQKFRACCSVPQRQTAPAFPPGRTRHLKKGLLLQSPPDKKSGDHGRLLGEPWVGGGRPEAAEPAGQDLLSKGSGRGGSARGLRSPRSPRRGGARGRSRGRGGQLAGLGGRWAAIHLGDVAAIAGASRPLPTRPPTRPLAAGFCAAALPRPDGERQCLPARRARRVSPAAAAAR